MKTTQYLLLIIFIHFCGLTYSQSIDSLKTVVAQKGDGIYKILRENGYSAKDYYNIFLELNAEKIGEDDSLIKGETYFLPQLIAEAVDSLVIIIDTVKLQSKYRYADTIIDNQLEGAMIYLISGHGGPDPGAVAVVDGKQISEDEYAYDICLRMAKKIEEHGGQVYMIINDPNDGIRDDRYLPIDYDEYCWPDLEIPRDHNQRLNQRADAVNDLYHEHKDIKYQRMIEIHLDSRSVGATVDVFFYYFPGSNKGKATAEAIQKTFSEKYAKHQPNRGYEGTVSARNLMVIRKVLPPAILIELGNIQNERDRKRFLEPSNREALAKWIVEGLINDFHNSK